MPRSNVLNPNQKRITLRPTRKTSKFTVRSRRKSVYNKKKYTTEHDISSSSDSELSTLSESSIKSSHKPIAPTIQSQAQPNTLYNDLDLHSKHDSMESHDSIPPPIHPMEHESKDCITLSGRKRKRSRDYESDFDNVDEYNKKNSDLSISYQLPSPKRHPLSPSSSHVNVGDSVYLIFQEYIEKYRECRGIFGAVHELLDINDDIESISYLCRNTGYIDGKVAAVYKPSFVDLGDSWLEAMARCIECNEDIDIVVLRNWRIIVLEVIDDHGVKQQVIIHEIHDHLGASRVSEYVLHESSFLESIETFKRGDIVQIAGGEYGRIFEIKPFDSEYKLSPFKCLSIMGLDDAHKMDISADGQRVFRCSPWDIELVSANDIEKSDTLYVDGIYDGGKVKFVDFIKDELVRVLPSKVSVFSRYFKDILSFISDEGVLEENELCELQRRLYEIKREISYKWLCLEEKERSKYNDEWVNIVERIIYLSVPGEQDKLVNSVKSLSFP